jgi:hypothetical protein
MPQAIARELRLLLDSLIMFKALFERNRPFDLSSVYAEDLY